MAPQVRDSGFYLVKFKDDSEWEIAEWWNNSWQRCGSEMYYYDEDVEEVSCKFSLPDSQVG